MRMQLIDWIIVIVPMVALTVMAFYSTKYVRGVVDFLAAGRVAGRYVLCIGGLEAGLSVITLVAGAEQNYQTGFSVGFWSAVASPIWIYLSLTGFVTYRWRETKCLSMGEFLEKRYGSKFFRIFCASLRTLAEMVTNAIGPAVATNFFIYYMGLPHRVTVFGISMPCYAIIVTLCLIIATIFIWPSGRVSLLITDSVQGILSYPIFVIIVGYILLNFSWFDDIAPCMWNRVEGESFMNPFDVSRMRDFNVFAIVVTILGGVLNRAGWTGNDTGGSAKNAHEQKISGILGQWKNGFATMMIMLLAVLTIVFMSSPNFMTKNRFKMTSYDVRQALSEKVLEEAVADKALRTRVITKLKEIPAREQAAYQKYQQTVAVSAEKLAAARSASNPSAYLPLMQNALKNQKEGKPVPVEVRATMVQPPLSQKINPDTDYLGTVRQELGDTPEARLQFQKVRSLYNQMMMPTVVGKLFPTGMMGLFCLLMVMLLISTDDSRIFNASSTLVQDVVLPFYKRHLGPKQHILLLRLVSAGVSLFFLIVSLFFAQLDYINMFTTIMCSLWLGGAGPVMLGGLYTRFGNLAGAWAAIALGSGTSALGLIFQRNWADIIYPFLEKMQWVDPLDKFLRAVSGPFNPWIQWSMDKVKFPINSYEIYFISMVLSIGGYVAFSYLTYKPFDLDKLLHRGKYAEDPNAQKPVHVPWSVKRVINAMVGITPEYTKGDRILAWSVFFYSFVYGFLTLFVMIATWNIISPWPHEWWTYKFLITSLIVSGIIGIVSTVWFLLGGVRDMFGLFYALEHRVVDENDNGQILHEEDQK